MIVFPVHKILMTKTIANYVDDFVLIKINESGNTRKRISWSMFGSICIRKLIKWVLHSKSRKQGFKPQLK
jgi:hypothetical protein